MLLILVIVATGEDELFHAAQKTVADFLRSPSGRLANKLAIAI